SVPSSSWGKNPRISIGLGHFSTGSGPIHGPLTPAFYALSRLAPTIIGRPTRFSHKNGPCFTRSPGEKFFYMDLKIHAPTVVIGITTRHASSFIGQPFFAAAKIFLPFSAEIAVSSFSTGPISPRPTQAWFD